MFSYSQLSLQRLGTCVEPIQRVMGFVIQVYDNSILTGHRGEVEQNYAFDHGYSQKRWPDGKHNSFPSKAVDACPFHKKYGKLVADEAQIRKLMRELDRSEQWVTSMIREHYCVLAGHVLATAAREGIVMTWGADWDRDNDLFDNGFDDLGHFEVP